MSGGRARAVLARAEPLTIGLSVPLFARVAGGLAVLASAADAMAVGLPAAATLGGVAALLAAAIVLAAGARPAAAPFRARTHAVVLILLAAGLALDTAAWPAADRELLGGPLLVVVLLFQLPLALLRPPLDVVCGGLAVAAVLVAAAAVADDPALLAARAAAVATAALAPSLAAAVFGRTALGRLRVAAGDVHAEAPADSLRLSVQQEAVARLEAEAVPLIDGVLARQALTSSDAARAGEIAQALRSALLADLARGWLADAGVAAADPRGYAERMTPQQRTAVRTALAALPLVDPAHPGSARLTGQDGDAELVLELPLAALPDRRRVSSLIPLLRAAFASADLRIDADRAVLTATFTADA